MTLRKILISGLYQIKFRRQTMATTANTGAEGCNKNCEQCINKTIKKDVDKIVDKYDIEELNAQCDAQSNKTVSYCRCWKSKKVNQRFI